MARTRLPGGRRPSRGGSGFTLVEILVATGLMVVFLSALYQFWMMTTRYSAELEDRIYALRRGQLALAALTQEARQARRLLYPAPCVKNDGTEDKPGFVLINGAGHPIIFSLKTRPGETDPAAPRLLERLDGLDGKKSVVADGVIDFQCRVPGVPSGRDPGLIHIMLTLAGAKKEPLYLVTSARLQALDVRCPANR